MKFACCTVLFVLIINSTSLVTRISLHNKNSTNEVRLLRNDIQSFKSRCHKKSKSCDSQARSSSHRNREYFSLESLARRCYILVFVVQCTLVKSDEWKNLFSVIKWYNFVVWTDKVWFGNPANMMPHFCFPFSVPKALTDSRTRKASSTGTCQNEVKSWWRCGMQAKLTGKTFFISRGQDVVNVFTSIYNKE